MPTFIIDLNNGCTYDINALNLSEAKMKAFSFFSNTKTDVTILNHSGDVLTESLWFDYTPTNDDFVLCLIENGFYQLWTDEFNQPSMPYFPN